MPVKAYQYPVKAQRGTKVKPPSTPIKPEPKDTGPTILGSRMEDWGYRALLALGYKEENISVQKSIDGGRNLPGGQVVDIVLYKPTPCAISFKGEYWHGNPDEETFDDARIMNIYDEYVVVWWREAFTYDMMYNVLLARVGRP